MAANSKVVRLCHKPCQQHPHTDVATAATASTTTPHSQQAQSYPPQQQQQQGAAPNSNAEYIPLDFLDNQQTSNSDFFNAVVPDSNSTDIFDELFGK